VRQASPWYAKAMKDTITKGIDHIGVAVVYFCHDGNGSFVMARRSANTRDEHGRWDIGGGGLEFGKTVEEAIRDEVREEYCTDVLGYEFLGYRDVHRHLDGTPTHWIAVDFKVLVDRDKVANGEPHKFDAVDWFTFNTVPDEVHSQLPHIFSLYRHRLEVA
jgi:8-oxo-dGTP diphosphatase